MITLGLTGSIGMGKSTASRMLKRLGLPVHDADACVHELLARGGMAVGPVAAAFPAALRNGAIDRSLLGSLVFGKPAELAQLEAILHPIVRAAAVAFLKRQRRQRRRIALLDVPLLFETGGDRLCDKTIVVTAPPFVQESRVLSRPGMSPERLAQIRSRQMSEHEKCRRADYVVTTGLGKGFTQRRLAKIIKDLTQATDLSESLINGET